VVEVVDSEESDAAVVVVDDESSLLQATPAKIMEAATAPNAAVRRRWSVVLAR
jgi:hypothetical protein